eukprot:SAG31_NODE_989_length_10527_cov_14.905639_11_plen_66_part_00
MSGGWGSATTTTPSDAASAMHQTEDAEMWDVAREDAAGDPGLDRSHMQLFRTLLRASMRARYITR